MHRTLKSICHRERDQHKCESAQTQSKHCNTTTAEQESEVNQGFMGGKQKQTLAEVPDAGLPFHLPHSCLSLASHSPFPPLPPSPGEPFGVSSHPLNVVHGPDSDVGQNISPPLDQDQRQSTHSVR